MSMDPILQTRKYLTIPSNPSSIQFYPVVIAQVITKLSDNSMPGSQSIISSLILIPVFAYGATGSGKTYTMLGSAGNPGITFLTVMELYRRINEMSEEYETEIHVSYVEVSLSLN